MGNYSLRFPGESESEFRMRAERAGRIARLLIEACLTNHRVRQCIADEQLPMYTEESVRRSPIVRVEYEQAIAIGELGSTLSATKSKHWGDGPWVMPLSPDDWFYLDRITYVFRENSLYNRRFEQRRRMKELLGRRYRTLVSQAQYKRTTKALFLQGLKADQADAIRRCLQCEPGQFWRAARGKSFLTLPPRMLQLEFDFEDDEEPRK